MKSFVLQGEGFDRIDSLPPERLRAFARAFVRQVRRFVSSAVVDQMIQDAVNEVTQAGPAPPPPAPRAAGLDALERIGNGRPFTLRLEHECRSQCCRRPQCLLCQCNPLKPCITALRRPPNAYVQDQAIVAPCGSVLCLRVVDREGAPVEQLPEALVGKSLMITLVDARKCADVLGPADGELQQPAPAGVDQHILRQTFATDGAKENVSVSCHAHSTKIDRRRLTALTREALWRDLSFHCAGELCSR
jgi:hypothetical protein